ncbi:MAG: lipoyl synthase [Actinobacteria bacterium]|nr:lipoyl synthase [Actinomycetota bacterium]MBT3686689.1 lipoyl synthase [Actinomycetota bacterium]MBT4038385.1 lipoyl synthase [Actinomycetota bacterium]MBT4279665.1 lipoyl synthase [Actinomycetota bacterium]MBT4343391.1 lipoyl synthase [Actinomycetota bacterium]
MSSAAPPAARPFRVRWLGRVRYRDALALQRGTHEHGADDHLLLLEHHAVYTLGVRATTENLLAPPEEVGADLEVADRGGDITFHGPGQLVGYPLLHLPGKRGGGMADTVAYVRSVEELLIGVCRDLGLADVGRLEPYPGVWVDPEGPNPRKVAAIGVKLTRARTMHGFALNVDPDLSFFDRMVPCGITGLGVTSLAAEGVEATMAEVVDLVVERAAAQWARGPVERADVAWRSDASDLSAFSRGQGPGERPPVGRKPEWMRVPLDTGPEYRRLRGLMREQQLVTVCEEAGCPNIFDCWNDGTATFMINGERCTRACGFCLVDTRRPGELDGSEPGRVAAAVADMGLAHAVVTAVARDDLPDGGASAFAATITAVREASSGTAVEVLIPDCKGDPDALATIFDARPDVLNHNIETVARLQRRVRPSAGYARSLSVLARACAAGLTTKSSIMVGLGETDAEVEACLADLAAVGCNIVTIGQYLRPTTNHLPVERWVDPALFDRWAEVGRALGIAHVEAGPLTRSSYHAREAADAAGAVPVELARR